MGLQAPVVGLETTTYGKQSDPTQSADLGKRRAQALELSKRRATTSCQSVTLTPNVLSHRLHKATILWHGHLTQPRLAILSEIYPRLRTGVADFEVIA